jgi:hypothetical protein
VTPLTSNSVLQRHPDVITTEAAGGYLVLDTTSFNCLSFAGSAARIWELLAEPMSVAAICERLRREYRVDAAVCLKETLAHVRQLADRGLVQENGPAT